MDLAFSASEEAFRAEARAWLRANVPRDLPPSGSVEGFAAHVACEKQLFAAGWSVVAWPRPYGGRDASITEWLIFEEEYYRAGAPGRVSQNGIFLLSPTIFESGRTEQQDRWLPSMATGEVIWAKCWSEPEAGSDLASLRSTASRDDARGGWVLNGQKTWSSRAAYAHWGFGLFRSDPESERHRGLTYFCFPLDAEGVHVATPARYWSTIATLPRALRRLAICLFEFRRVLADVASTPCPISSPLPSPITSPMCVSTAPKK